MPEERPAPPPPPYPAYAVPPRAGRPWWLWIVVAAGVVILGIPVLLIVAALTIPQMLKIKKTANETSAVQTMRSIATAEVNYNLAYPANGFACSLDALGGDPKSGPPSADGAQLLDSALASTGQKSGYDFAISDCTKVTVNGHDTITAYKLNAIPQSVGRTGIKGFCADESGIIQLDPTGGTICTQPLQ